MFPPPRPSARLDRVCFTLHTTQLIGCQASGTVGGDGLNLYSLQYDVLIGCICVPISTRPAFTHSQCKKSLKVISYLHLCKARWTH